MWWSLRTYARPFLMLTRCTRAVIRGSRGPHFGLEVFHLRLNIGVLLPDSDQVILEDVFLFFGLGTLDALFNKRLPHIRHRVQLEWAMS